jgi:hypothetical protein
MFLALMLSRDDKHRLRNLPSPRIALAKGGWGECDFLKLGPSLKIGSVRPSAQPSTSSMPRDGPPGSPCEHRA